MDMFLCIILLNNTKETSEYTMTNKLSRQMTAYLLKNNIVSADETDIYRYCIAYILDTLFYIFFVLIFSIVLDLVPIGLIFLLVMLPTRHLAGGAHAKTEFLCMLLSYGAAFIIIIITPKLSPVFSDRQPVIYALISLLVFIMAPVDTPNKRLPDAVKKQMQKKLLIYLIVLSLLFVLCYYKKNSLYCTVINLSLTLTAASQLTGILINWHTKGSDVNDTKCCNM